MQNLPHHTRKQIVTWAKQHHKRTGAWPTVDSGTIRETGGEVWKNVDMALREGTRALRGGSSLAQLLAEKCGIRNRMDLPPFTVKQILAWAEGHRRQTGKWPKTMSGQVPDAPDETWLGIDDALRQGNRGLGGGSSLAQLLAERRGVRNRGQLPRLTLKKILMWADRHRERTGKWPNPESGAVIDAAGETWKAVQMACVRGLRGLRGGDSISRLLVRYRGKAKRSE